MTSPISAITTTLTIVSSFLRQLLRCRGGMALGGQVPTTAQRGMMAETGQCISVDCNRRTGQ